MNSAELWRKPRCEFRACCTSKAEGFMDQVSNGAKDG